MDDPIIQSIAIPEDAVKKLEALRRMVDQAQREFKLYAMGLATGQGVPEGWKLDLPNRLWIPTSRPASI